MAGRVINSSLLEQDDIGLEIYVEDGKNLTEQHTNLLLLLFSESRKRELKAQQKLQT